MNATESGTPQSPRDSSGETLIGRIAVREYGVDAAEVHRALAIQIGSSRRSLLGQILLHIGAIDPPRLRDALDRQAELRAGEGDGAGEDRPEPASEAESLEDRGASDRGGDGGGPSSPAGEPEEGPAPPRRERRFGQSCVDLGFASPDHVVEALTRQLARTDHGVPVRIGEVLVESGRVTPIQVHRVLEEQGIRVLCCPACEIGVNVEGHREGYALPCPRCEGRLADAPAAEERSLAAEETVVFDPEKAESVRLFGAVAIEMGLLSTEALEQGLTFRAGSEHRRIGEVLALLGHMSFDDVSRVLQRQEEGREEPEDPDEADDSLLGRVASLNPISPSIGAHRDCVIHGRLPDTGPFIYATLVSIALLAFGWTCFQHASYKFAERI